MSVEPILYLAKVLQKHTAGKWWTYTSQLHTRAAHSFLHAPMKYLEGTSRDRFYETTSQQAHTIGQ
jgi:hypothetical protein